MAYSEVTSPQRAYACSSSGPDQPLGGSGRPSGWRSCRSMQRRIAASSICWPVGRRDAASAVATTPPAPLLLLLARCCSAADDAADADALVVAAVAAAAAPAAALRPACCKLDGLPAALAAAAAAALLLPLLLLLGPGGEPTNEMISARGLRCCTAGRPTTLIGMLPRPWHCRAGRQARASGLGGVERERGSVQRTGLRVCTGGTA